MNFQYDFTEKQKMLRKEWLLLTIMLYFVLPSFSLLLMFLNPDPLQNPVAGSGPLAIVVGLCFYNLFWLLFFYILYRCAYKKPGTRYLTFQLVLSALGLVFLLFFLFKSLSMLDLCLLVVSVLANSWWCVLSYKLRELNHQIKALKRAAVESENLTQ